MAIVAPIVAVIVQMAVSRQNEFQADATAVRIVGDTQWASERAAADRGRCEAGADAGEAGRAHMAIINPFTSRARAAMSGLFRTHPPTTGAHRSASIRSSSDRSHDRCVHEGRVGRSASGPLFPWHSAR